MEMKSQSGEILSYEEWLQAAFDSLSTIAFLLVVFCDEKQGEMIFNLNDAKKSWFRVGCGLRHVIN